MIGVAVTLASLLGAAADTLMLYAPGFASDPFSAVLAVPADRMLAGFLLGVAIIPLYGLGYWMIYERIKPAGFWLSAPILVLGIYTAAIGAIWHATVGMIARVINATGDPSTALSIAEPYFPFAIPLLAAFYLLFAIVTLWFASAVLSGKTPFPRWIILISPLIPQIVFTPVIWIAPTLADFLVPAGANLAHALFFGVATALLWNKTDRPSA
ncbi:MAG: hypothetical protein GYB68_16720 [Chloroflexi bacterium]|nr:hypothetical protein [Chloroflexota bacterium]